MSRTSNGSSKSAGKSRRAATPQKSSRASVYQKTVSIIELLADVDNISDEEKMAKYENYEETGQFESDFVYLSRLKGIKITVGNRPKIPSTVESPEPGNVKKTGLNSSKGKGGSDSTIFVEDNISELDSETSPKTYVIARDKYDFFKPRLEIETEMENNKDYIKALYMRGWKIDLRVISVLSRTVKNLDKLSVLNMWNVGLDNATVHSLSECLSSIPSLKTLILDGNNFVTNQGFHVFLRKSVNLQSLSLRHCGITEIGARDISKALLDNNQLLTLNLCFNNLKDEGIKLLAEALYFNRTLLSLSVGSNGIGDKGVTCVAHALSQFPLTDDQVLERRNQLSIANEFQNEDVASQVKPPSVPTSMSNIVKASREKASRKKDRDGGKGKSGRGKSNWDKAKVVKSTPKSDVPKDSEGEESEHELRKANTNPLLNKGTVINGQLWLPGNRTLINLNLWRNKITKDGLDVLYAAVKYQDKLANNTATNVVSGLMKLSLRNNAFNEDNNETYKSLVEILNSRVPLHNNIENSFENDLRG